MFALALDAPGSGRARLLLTGHLDDEAARDLLHTAAGLVRSGCVRLVVDLRGLSGCDLAATYALVACRRLGRYLPGGVTMLGERELLAGAG